ncbi:MAG: paraquat-inducible protein B, partial [Acetobacteraceae bacterium]|nr:paraquat-inducible protein B [Acetobacteraceae bacterium]
DRLATHLDAQVGAVADAVEGAAGAATKTLTTADDALVQVRDGAKTSLRNVDALVADARRQLEGRGGDLNRVLTDLDRSLHSVDTLLASANGLLAPRSGFRGDLEAAMRDLSATASSLRTFARTVERDPSAVLTGRTGR